MGKPKLRSSIRALQVAIASLRPVGPICVQLAKTDSFRGTAGDLFHSFSSASISSSSTSLELPKPTEALLASLLDENSLSPTIPTSSPTEVEVIPRGSITSTRFFFSPSTTKSIMDENKEFGKSEREETEDKKVGFCEESVTMAMASEDPYRDFRVSMEEMVVAHGVREWPQLQELLHCYLRLNEKRTHKTIVLAFVDLLMSLTSQDKDSLGLDSLPSSLPLCTLDL